MNDAQDFDRVAVEEKARSEFQADASVRAEFQSVENYVSYCVARAQGRVRILGEKR